MGGRVKIAALLLLIACATTRLVPVLPRPDTRRVAGIYIDSATARATGDFLQAALPHEGSVCYYGGARDTVIAGRTMLILVAQRVYQARHDSADEFHVWYPDGLEAGCASDGLIGIAHSHPYVIPIDPCTHSIPDAFLLSLSRDAMFSVVFCGDGRVEVLYQDGRRIPDRWRKADAP
jgi:hypothetical protein